MDLKGKILDVSTPITVTSWQTDDIIFGTDFKKISPGTQCFFFLKDSRVEGKITVHLFEVLFF